ncbi:diacylglycerol kinase catalytic subunit [Deinococcus phoenicis]|uniref:Diacylglycerol kinase catalytic subunit n=1 Tax=Deinococcus phoenicis TaxID=1476583 RepID=A0A016QUV0_9DEIO|nr:diacylglycerol kinase family protein [Deinococcus phoenicis]EYB69647.1 diacylglycerol kinase catalytic subunit [Deinococcus phoenicis]
MTLDTQTVSSPVSMDATDATLIFNARAGSSRRASPDLLVEALAQQGYRPVYRATEDEADLAAALGHARGTVFVAGGDGTVRAAALHLAGRADVRLGILPMGTANNIARTLGVEGDPLDVIARYANAGTRALDLGRIQAPWGEDLFLEACGCGAFAEVLDEYDPEGSKSPLRAVSAVATTFAKFEPLPLALTLDGEVQPEVSSTLVEVMNIKATGPGLRLATTADPFDGQLNVIQVNAEGRGGLLSYLAALAQDRFEDLPSVLNDPVRRLQIPYLGQVFHVDGEIRAAQPGVSGVVQVEVWAGALPVLVPQRQEG